MTFDEIYRTNAWNGVETRSGPGSGTIATRKVAPQIARLVAQLKITSVLDLGCGEGSWMPDLPGYEGVDVSVVAIEEAHRRHPDRKYDVVPDLRSIAGVYDLVICRDVIQHLPLEEGVAIVRWARQHSNYCLLSTYRGARNVNITAGDTYSPNLEVRPFSLPQPLGYFFDGYAYHETTRVRDSRKFLALFKGFAT